MHESENVRCQCVADERKERLIDVLAQLNLDDLTLAIATGLNCDSCPVAAEQEKCYDKTICFRTMRRWLEGGNDN